MLAGRMSELEYLNQYYEQKGSQMLVVYGQKHIGKTTLVKAFAQDKPNDYYLAKACSEREQRYQWGMQLKADNRDEAEIGRESFSGNGKDFPDFADIFSVFGGNGSKRVIIIDEFQNIVKVSETFMRELVLFIRA